MAPFAWPVAAAFATWSFILPSMAYRRAMGYDRLPYDQPGSFLRSLGSPSLLPTLLLIVLAWAIVCVVSEDEGDARRRRFVTGGAVAWTFLVLYAVQGRLFFADAPSFAEWIAAVGVVLGATPLFSAIAWLTLPVRTKLCRWFAK